MHVAILGGGMQGCCCALALAARGVHVTIFDRNDRLLTRAAVANEGKVHLGYMYANDQGLSTARMMIGGALAFAPFLERHLGIDTSALALSEPAAYVVHRDSQVDVESAAGYLGAVHALLDDAADGGPGRYFGRDLSRPLRRWSNAERNDAFDGSVAVAAFDSPEVAVNPVALADMLRDRVHADPRIEVRLGHEVLKVEEPGAPVVVTGDPGRPDRHSFDHVVNALWEGRLAVDAALGLKPGRPWLHRLKYGVAFSLPGGAGKPPSATVISGPFGEVVTYPDRSVYLTWYPVCLAAISRDMTPPVWPTYPEEPERTRLAAGTIEAISGFVHALRGLDPAALKDLTVRGGAIVAWGATDIYDVRSELHHRYEIGVTSHDRYHSIDPGKLTMAPHFADVLADRILGNVRA